MIVSFEDIEKTKQAGLGFAETAASQEAEFKDLKRREHSLLGKLTIHYKRPTNTMAEAKARALFCEEYLTHLSKMNAAQKEFLRCDKAYKVIRDWFGSITARCYLENGMRKLSRGGT